MGDATGDGNPGDGEGPVHEVSLSSFSIDVTSVTNADFARFVAATEFSTEAEEFGFSAVFHLALAARPDEVMGSAAGTPWWLGVRGADWRHPGGSLSDNEGLDEHPVVHVSWNDASAYCAWAGRRLPRRPSGSTPHVGASTAPVTPGATTCSTGMTGGATSGRDGSPRAMI